MNGEGIIDGNSFVHESMGAVDGISYNGRATPITYEQLLSVPELPDEFRTLTLRFVADGETVKELSFRYGESVDKSEIPAVPEKDHPNRRYEAPTSQARCPPSPGRFRHTR